MPTNLITLPEYAKGMDTNDIRRPIISAAVGRSTSTTTNGGFTSTPASSSFPAGANPSPSPSTPPAGSGRYARRSTAV